MCGRFSLEQYPKTILEDFDIDLPAYPKFSEDNFSPRDNITPSSNILTVSNSDNGHQLGEMHWGIVPPWAKAGQFKRPLINARSETIWDKPSFKHLIKSKRCVILANSFFEWARTENQKQAYKVTMQDGQDMAMAGIYQISSEGEMQCCIVTMQANQQMATIHQRMPVLLNEKHLTSWITEDDKEVLDEVIYTAANADIALGEINLARKVSEKGQQSFDLAPMN